MELGPDLVARARAGDRGAQAAFVAMYEARVYAVCFALAGPDAEDCAQDALLAALLGLPRFDDQREGRLGTFVLRIARNRCIDRARSARVKAERDPCDPDRLVGAPPPDVVLARASEHEAVRGAVLALPEDQRSVIALHLWGELDYAQIADVVGVPIGTVRSRLARARERLRAWLAPLVQDSGQTSASRTREMP